MSKHLWKTTQRIHEKWYEWDEEIDQLKNPNNILQAKIF